MPKERDEQDEAPQLQPEQTTKAVRFSIRESARVGGTWAYTVLREQLTNLGETLANAREAKMPGALDKIRKMQAAVQRMKHGLVAVSLKPGNGILPEYLVAFVDKDSTTEGIPSDGADITVIRYRPSDSQLTIQEARASNGKVLVPSDASNVTLGLYPLATRDGYTTMFLPENIQIGKSPDLFNRIDRSLVTIINAYSLKGRLAKPEAMGVIRPGRRQPTL